MFEAKGVFRLWLTGGAEAANCEDARPGSEDGADVHRGSESAGIGARPLSANIP